MSDEAYLKAIQDKIDKHKREQELAAFLDERKRKQERRKYLQIPEAPTGFSTLEQ
jgi:hypothetical protein